MSQVSYGTITITDTNDIERIYVVYAKSTTNTDAPTATASTWTESITNAPGSGNYIWQRTVAEQSGTHDKTYGNPVCVTGPQGGTGATGRGVSSIITTYCNYGTGTPEASYAGWQNTVPTYDSSKPNYWVKTVITYTTGSPATDTSIYKDNGITDAIYNSAVANSIAQGANENAQGALSQAVHVDTLLGGHFLWHGTNLGSSTAAGARVIQQVKNSNNVDVSNDPTQWLHNVNIGANGIQLRYNELVMAQLKMDTTNGSALTFYSPSVSTQGNKLMELTGNVLNFYNTSGTLTSSFGNSITLASNGATITVGSTSSGKANTYIDSNGLQLRVATTAYATLNSNGLTLSKGGIEAGTIGSNGGLYISTIDKAGITINGHTPGTNDAKWRAIIGSKFGVDADGNLYASNATISGAITATSLTLSSGVQIPASTGISGLSTVATTGSYNDLDNKPTIPSLTGYIYVDGTVGTTPADGATGFVVSSSGLLTASNAVIYGSIYASKGYIGGWQIGTDGNKTLHNGNANTSPIPGGGVIILSKGIAGPTTATGVLPANQTWAITAGDQFGVTTAGKLYASGADITGAVHMESGTIDYGVTIGKPDGVHISLNETEIGFWRNSEDNDINKTAYITNQYMYIPYTVVLNEMQVGTKPKYKEVENPSESNPSEQGWYEIVNEEYILTADTAIVSGKIYYEIEGDTPLWSWRKMDSGNLRLMWLGGEV